ncbi:MAG: UDP-N-acetylmuramoyl-L-alanyl-D-glutamate--2,6-diaminopimelate ligase [Actinobacteria bacterium]|nr:UDP-N-acetylmuramoyl-L-alanyl-D-glutamate--2,6-diaminopimelate ligase [Actinomycetota bacterium]
MTSNHPWPPATSAREPVALAGLAGDLATRGLGGELRGEGAVTDATHDSRQAGPGWLFCCVRGEHADGHDFAADAIARGASGLLVERWLAHDVAQVRVPDVRAAMGPAAARIHDHPSHRLRVVGVTGTNGKTTTTYLLESAFGAAALGTGLIGTVETRIHGEAQPGVRTTPEGTDLQRTFAHMYDRGVDAVAMEVSSHGLDLRRVDGTRFEVVAFTNLSRDHLDHHHTMEAYFAAKQRLFTSRFAERAVVVVDSIWGRRLAARTSLGTTTLGFQTGTYRLTDVRVDAEGTRLRLRGPDADRELRTRLIGAHNGLNAATAYLAATVAGIEPDAAASGIATAPPVPGRLEPVAAGHEFAVLVDYAHTPDALQHALAACRAIAEGRTIVVVGCGGDRDRDKRPQMGAVAATADVAVLTSDNPRSEPPEAIVAAVEAGAREAARAGAPADITVRLDRREAIAAALDRAEAGDVVLIAGKGHETGQEIAGRTVPFDDRLVAADLLADATGRGRHVAGGTA